MDEYNRYECTNCNEVFTLEEPPHDGAPVCEECRLESLTIITEEERIALMSEFKTGFIPEIICNINDILDMVNDIESSDKSFEVAEAISKLKTKIITEFIGI